jgi:probable rRNA maturation factor
MRSKLSIRNRQRIRPVDCKLLARVTRALLRNLLQKESFDLSVCLVDAPESTRLNEKFLQHRGSTDVITFDYGDASEPELLSGEIFVCLDEAVKQARRFRTSWQSELVRYVVHGILHLCGYDDRKPRARRTMKREEDRLVKQLTARFAVRQLGRV